MHFINREKELAALEESWARRGAQFLALYGRRRIGKTTLLLAFARDKPYIYWVASRLSSAALLSSFSRTVHQFTSPDSPVRRDFSFGDWETALLQLAPLARERRILLIIDEFPYAVEAEPGLPSLLQNVWDHQLKESNLFLAISGSHVGIMERETGSYQAPLYGRTTGLMLLHPLDFPAVRQFLPRYSLTQQITTYAIVGGIPSYLERWDDGQSVMRNIETRVLGPASLFQLDPPYLLSDELGQPRNYAAVLLAIAAGKHTPAEIQKPAGIKGQVSGYLQTLRNLRLIERQVPATVRQPERSRRSRYVIADPYLNFYFRFLAPNLELIEQGRIRAITDEIAGQLDAFVGRVAFETLCRAWLVRSGDAGRLPFVPQRVGQWWSSRAQVDAVAINYRHKAVLLGEAKWQTRPVGQAVLEALKTKTRQVLPEPGWTVHYALFARGGFTQQLQDRATEERVILVNLQQLAEGL